MIQSALVHCSLYHSQILIHRERCTASVSLAICANAARGCIRILQHVQKAGKIQDTFWFAPQYVALFSPAFLKLGSPLTLQLGCLRGNRPHDSLDSTRAGREELNVGNFYRQRLFITRYPQGARVLHPHGVQKYDFAPCPKSPLRD